MIEIMTMRYTASHAYQMPEVTNMYLNYSFVEPFGYGLAVIQEALSEFLKDTTDTSLVMFGINGMNQTILRNVRIHQGGSTI